MSRPDSHADLPARDRLGDTVFSFHPTSMESPSAQLLYAWGQLAVAAEKAGLLLQVDSYQQAAYAPATEEQLDRRLVILQQKWDSAKDQYEVIQLTGKKPESNEYAMIESVRWYSKREGFNLPWDEDSSAY